MNRPTRVLWVLVIAIALVAELGVGCGGSAPAPTKVPPSFLIDEVVLEQPHGAFKVLYTIGGFSLDNPMARARQYFGGPERQEAPEGFECYYEWPSMGLSISHFVGFAIPHSCDPSQPIMYAYLSGPRWHTKRGLRVGDSVARLRHLYPHATHHGVGGREWYLERSPRTKIIFMDAWVRNGRVATISVLND